MSTYVGDNIVKDNFMYFLVLKFIVKSSMIFCNADPLMGIDGLFEGGRITFHLSGSECSYYQNSFKMFIKATVYLLFLLLWKCMGRYCQILVSFHKQMSRSTLIA